MNFASLEPGLLMLRQRAKSQVPFTVENVFCRHLSRRARNNSWKLCSPVAIEPRGGQAELISPEQNQYQMWSISVLCRGKGINS